MIIQIKTSKMAFKLRKIHTLIPRSSFPSKRSQATTKNVNLRRMKLILTLYGSCFFRLATLFIHLVASGPAPPLQLKTRGENEGFSTWSMRALYSLFFSFSCWVYISGICLDQRANGLKILISKNARHIGCHRPKALTSEHLRCLILQVELLQWEGSELVQVVHPYTSLLSWHGTNL